MTLSRRRFVGALGAAAAAMATPVPGVASTIELEDGAVVDSGKMPISLDLNENPYGCSDSVLSALRAVVPRSNRYAGSEYVSLKARLAKLHGVAPEQVALGCGSVEVLRMTASAFLGPGKNAVVAVPTFDAIATQGKLVGAEVIEVPIAHDWSHDLKAMRSKVNEHTGLIYICNPNNPTGSLTPRKDLEAFLATLPDTAYVVIDEAYHHYVTPSGFYSSFLDHPVKNPRVIVVRTFSNIYGLAGIRVGYGVMSPEVAARLEEFQLPQSVSAVAVRAALAAVDDTAWVDTCVKRNADSRQEFLNQANARMLRAIDSHGNFAMLNLMRPVDAVIEYFAKNGVLVGRQFPPLVNYVRVSLGTPDEMLAFWQVLDGMHIDMHM